MKAVKVSSKEQVKTATKRELNEFAKVFSIKNYSRKSTAELRAEILENLGKPVPKPEKQETPKEFFERVSKLTEVEQVQQACEELLEKLGTEKIEVKSKSNKLRPYTRLFKELTPTKQTIHLFFDFRSSKEKPYIKRHLYFKFTGLSEVDWDKANEEARQRKASKMQEREEPSSETYKIFSLEKYLAAIKYCLNSSDPWELGIGLIAISGRRPSEISIFANFWLPEVEASYLDKKEYAIQLDGLAKKRDKNPQTVVPLLIPATEFLEALQRFRKTPEVKKYRETYENLITLGFDNSQAWETIENSLGGQLRAATERNFDFLPKIDTGENRKNILLRACCTKLLVLRDRNQEGITQRAKTLYAGTIAGHVIPIFRKDGKVVLPQKTSASTLHYEDYEPDSKEIPLLKNIVKLQQENTEEMKVQELTQKIEKLEKLLEEKSKEITEKDQKIAKLETRLEIKRNLPEPAEMSNKTLFQTRKPGATEERLNRSWEALKNYNNSTPEYKISPTNQILRSLSGVNGTGVKKWLENHEDEVLSHCKTHQFTKYYNNRYRSGEKTTEAILEEIRQDYLEI